MKPAAPTLKCFAMKSLVMIGSAVILLGCAHDYSVEPTFGLSVGGAIEQQTVNPRGALTDGVSPGMDGVAASATVDQYQKSFIQPQRLGNVMSLGVGTDSTSQGSSTTSGK